MRARADAGEAVVIEANGLPRYVFRLSNASTSTPLSNVLAEATAGLSLKRDKTPMRRRS
jgi:hypothetical protein